MWWMFEKLNEENGIVLYAYSRENRDLDGRIQIKKASEEVEMVKPCTGDEGSKFAVAVALEKACHIITIGYPDRKQVACG